MSDFVLDAVQEGENDEFVDESLKEDMVWFSMSKYF